MTVVKNAGYGNQNNILHHNNLTVNIGPRLGLIFILIPTYLEDTAQDGMTQVRG